MRQIKLEEWFNSSFLNYLFFSVCDILPPFNSLSPSTRCWRFFVRESDVWVSRSMLDHETILALWFVASKILFTYKNNFLRCRCVNYELMSRLICWSKLTTLVGHNVFRGFSLQIFESPNFLFPPQKVPKNEHQTARCRGFSWGRFRTKISDQWNHTHRGSFCMNSWFFHVGRASVSALFSVRLSVVFFAKLDGI